jgi:hypothetical protein
MIRRRRNGATLGLVAVCILVIAVIGVGIYFLTKILGGGREIANATDAGTLNVAKHIIRDARVPTPIEFEDCEYPLGCKYINLLTYNRCVAKAIMIAMNASNMTGPGPYKTNANKMLDDLQATGTLLATQIRQANPYFDDVINNVRMASNSTVKDGGQCNVAYMKAKGPTNIFFNSDQIAGVTVPISQTTISPKNELLYVATGTGTGYVAGYAPITVLGRTIYGVPVFPQQNPHLVSFWDFAKANAAFGAAPPNAVQLGGNAIEMKTGLLTGAVACAIVGAVELGTPGSGGTNVGQALLGSGFQFPAAASYGYMEFGNYPANGKPPGYDASDYTSNIFNNELFLNPLFSAGGNNGNQSTQVMFATDSGTYSGWLAWAQHNQNANPFPDPTYNNGQYPGGTVYFGAYNADLNPGYSAGNPPGQSIAKLMAKMSPADLNAACTLQLRFVQGLVGPCVAALPAMELTFKHKKPWPTPKGAQNFSQADWAKADLLTQFEGTVPTNAGGYSNHALVDLTSGPPASGLGIYPSALVPGKVPPAPPNMPVPQYNLPLQSPGTIYELIRAVQDPATCMPQTIKEITLRCKQIQPKTTDTQVCCGVGSLLNSQKLPMATAGPSPTWLNANKLYIYLPNGDLNRDLILSGVEPPRLTKSAPDGCCSAPNISNPCYVNQYPLNGTIVDAEHDQNVHLQPYLQIGGNLEAIDHADWQPGTGADNNFGRMTFQEIGIGSSTYVQIN